MNTQCAATQTECLFLLSAALTRCGRSWYYTGRVRSPTFGPMENDTGSVWINTVLGSRQKWLIGCPTCGRQESGSIYLQFTCSTALQLEVIFEVLEEYDWTSFSVVTTRHHGYEDFLDMVEGMTDGSFIGWERKSVVVLNVTDDAGGARTKRVLKDNEAQVSRRLERQLSERNPISVGMRM